MRANDTSATTTHGANRHAPRRYGVITQASAVTRITCPETKAAPLVAVPPRTMALGSVTPGRCRLTKCQTVRSAASFPIVTRTAARASRQRRRTRATIATTGPTTSTPRNWARRIGGSRNSGNPLIASKTLRSSEPTVPSRTTIGARDEHGEPSEPRHDVQPPAFERVGPSHPATLPAVDGRGKWTAGLVVVSYLVRMRNDGAWSCVVVPRAPESDLSGGL